MSLRIFAESLKNAPVLLKRLESFGKCHLYIQVFKVTWAGLGNTSKFTSKGVLFFPLWQTVKRLLPRIWISCQSNDYVEKLDTVYSFFASLKLIKTDFM